MMPSSLNNLIECFKMLPGIGERSAERLSYAILALDDASVELFSKSLKEVKNKIIRCSICNHLSEGEYCPICTDEGRDKHIICVVENPKNVILFEKIGTYNGLYHVLNGLISPLNGINPENINLENLMKRINDNDIKEIILALSPSIEGETTSLYIKKILEDTNITVSRIAQGIPIGVDMDYIDTMTLEMAFNERKNLS